MNPKDAQMLIVTGLLVIRDGGLALVLGLAAYLILSWLGQITLALAGGGGA